MESGELEILLSEEFRQEVERNIGRSAESIALDRRVPHARLVATQVKYLQRAEKKLPTYYASRAILPPLAFEQSSSEECAAHKPLSGALAIDLTCGLGVDTLYLSRRFERVVAIEHNPTLAAITRHNLALMGVDNVEVITGESEEFLERLTYADLIYADPDRRNAEGKKMVCLEDCSPNMVSLLPMLKEKSHNIVVKLSPMFDIKEALVAFGKGASVEVVSLSGEVKEVVAWWEKGAEESTITATALGCGTFSVEAERRPQTHNKPFDPTPYTHLVVPDAALRKAGLVGEWCRSEGLDHFGAYAFATERPTTTMGHIYNIEVSLPWQPKKLKPLIGGRLEVVRHSFPLSTAAICKALGAKEGAGDRWAFAEIDHTLWAMKISDNK